MNTSINFGVHLLKTQEGISNFTLKAKSNFCHAYRVNRFKEQDKNWYVVPFSG